MARNTEMTSRLDASSYLWWALLCFARGLVLVVPMAVLVVMFNRMGMSNTKAMLVSSLLLLPLALRPLAMTMVKGNRSAKWWMLTSLLVYALMMFVASSHLSPALDNLVLWICLVVMSLAGGTFEAAAAYCGQQMVRKENDGMLTTMILALLMAIVIGMGVMMLLAGNMEVVSRKIEESWSLALKVGAVMMLVIMLLVWMAARYMPDNADESSLSPKWQTRKNEFVAWWTADRRRWVFGMFVVLFPMHEFFLWRGSLLFLIDRGSIGGLMLSPQEMGFAFCTVAIALAMAGYDMGKGCIRRFGLNRCWWWMALAFTVPDALYVYLAYDMPDELWRITMILSVEQWCCGLGMAAFLYYIMYGKDTICSRAHLDACWSLSMLSIILTGLFTGAIQDYLGYRRFFVMVALLAIISLATLGWLVVKREKEKE